MRYAGFWSRLCANVVDVVALLPVYYLGTWIEGRSRTAALVVQIPLTLLFTAYVVYFHGRWGRTLGKMAAGIRVVNVAGDAISWRQAFLRSSVDAVLTLAFAATTVVGLWRIPSEEYLTLSSWRQRMHRVADLAPGRGVLGWANEIWFWGELIVLLFNRRKRALHDFIAGTVVIHDPDKPRFPVLDPDRLGILPLLDRR
jgi:uncharacterized RDD family membrane protein YckC